MSVQILCTSCLILLKLLSANGSFFGDDMAYDGDQVGF